MKFTHKQKDDIKINDIFVEPFLKKIITEKSTERYSSVKLFNIFNTDEYKIFISGINLSGKTIICKKVYSYLFEKGFIPILIQGSDIIKLKKEKIYNIIEQKFEKQYTYKNTVFSKIDTSKIVIIIDNIHKIPVDRHQERKQFSLFFNIIHNQFKNIFLTSTNIISNDIYNEYLTNYQTFEILEFGHLLRDELVSKWNKIGCEDDVNNNKFLRIKDDIEYDLNSIISRNYIPSTPFYILILLQSFQTRQQSNNQNYTLHGFYYQCLINDALSKAVIDRENISFYENLIKELAFHFYKIIGDKKINKDEFTIFYKKYCDDYAIDIKKHPITLTIKTFIDAKIIIFLTHLSKDRLIINNLLVNAKKIFKNEDIKDLDNYISEMNKLTETLPKQIFKEISIQESRREELEDKEIVEFEKKQKEAEEFEKTQKEKSIYFKENNPDDIIDVSELDMLSQVTLALNYIDILGQVVKKHWGSLNKKDKQDIINEIYSLGIRIISIHLKQIPKEKEPIIKFLKSIITRKHIKTEYLSEDKIEEELRKFLFNFGFLISFGIVKRITHSTGYEKLDPIFKEIETNNNCNLIKLINLSIKLEYYEIEFPIKEIKEIKELLEDKLLYYQLIRLLVIDYLRLFNIDYKDKQRVCQILGISVQNQLEIDKTSKIKKE